MSLGRALSRLRVLDLTHYIAGPYCTKLLGDYGAEVVKIEKPLGGDGARSLPPFFDDRAVQGNSGLFSFLNTSKQSVGIDLKQGEGTAILLGLVEKADVLVQNFRPGTLEKLGVNEAKLQKANPRLVSVSISNFGSTGPHRDYVMTDNIAYASGGWTFPMGELSREPVQPGGAFGQYVAGLYAAIGALQAVRNRDETNAAQTVEVSIQEALIATSLYDFVAFSYSGFVRKRSGKQFHLGFPNLVTLPCADGYVGVHPGLPHQIIALLELVERPDLAGDPRFCDMSNLPACADELHSALLPWMKERGKWDIYHAAQARGIPLSPIPSAREVLEWSQLRERNAFVDIRRSEDGRTVRIPGPPFREAGDPIVNLRSAPRLGEHTRAVLAARLGLEEGAIARLGENGTISPV